MISSMNSPEYNTTAPADTSANEVDKKAESSKLDDAVEDADDVPKEAPKGTSTITTKKPLSEATTELLKLYGGNDKATQSFYKKIDKKIEVQKQQQKQQKERGSEAAASAPAATSLPLQEGGEDVTLTFPQKVRQ